jgi:hypothetical protein
MSDLQDMKLEYLIGTINSYVIKVQSFKYNININRQFNSLRINYTVTLTFKDKFRNKRIIKIRNYDLEHALLITIATLEDLIELIEGDNRVSYVFNYNNYTNENRR